MSATLQTYPFWQDIEQSISKEDDAPEDTQLIELYAPLEAH